MKVAFCTSEAVPFAKTGGLADVCAALPIALEKLGHQLCVVMPQYPGVETTSLPVEIINDHVSQSQLGDHIPVFFIRHEKYFHRSGLYGDRNGDYNDNVQRFHYFCDQALQVLQALQWKADVIHCHDWQTSLIPVLLRYRFGHEGFWEKTKTLLTIHNLAYQGTGPAGDYAGLGFARDSLYDELFEFYGQINLLKAGIMTSERITTVSPQYAREIQTRELGCGLEGVLAKRRRDITGILNGIDTRLWNPETDPDIHKNYSPRQVADKQANKAFIQKKAGLACNPDTPLFGLVGRLSHQKGIDLLAEILPHVEEWDIQIIILGNGEKQYEDLLRAACAHAPERIALFLEFNEALAHQIYAGCDILLMPSRYEPCGLNQLIALRYGVIPLVFRTGGLADTITPYDQGGNGFVFDTYSANDFKSALRQAVDIYRDKDVFAALRVKAFSYDFSWDSSARLYADFYQQMVAE